MAKKKHYSSRHVDEAGKIDRGIERMHDKGLAEPSGPMKYAQAGSDPRRMNMGGALIKEDHNAPANLPQNYEIKYWPNSGRYTPEVLNDGPDGVDRQIDRDNDMKMKLFDPHKY